MSDYYLLKIICDPCRTDNAVRKGDHYLFNNINDIFKALIDDLSDPIDGLYIPIWYGEKIQLNVCINGSIQKINLHQYMIYHTPENYDIKFTDKYEPLLYINNIPHILDKYSVNNQIQNLKTEYLNTTSERFCNSNQCAKVIIKKTFIFDILLHKFNHNITNTIYQNIPLISLKYCDINYSLDLYFPKFPELIDPVDENFKIESKYCKNFYFNYGYTSTE